MKRRLRCKGILIGGGCLLACFGSGMAAPRFTESTIQISPEAPLESEVVTFAFELKNSGEVPAEGAQLAIEWPLMGYFVEVRGLNEPRIDHESRSIEGSLNLGPGEGHRVELDVLAPRDSGGDSLSVSVHLAHYGSGAELWDHKAVTIATRVPESGLRMGGLRISTAGILVLIWLICLVVVWMLVALRFRGRKGGEPGWRGFLGPRATALALMIPVGFWLMFLAMALRDYRALYEWTETTATVVGRRVISETVSSNSSRASGGGTVTTSSEIYSPELALRYPVDGVERFSTGYDTGSSLRIGGRLRREEELRNWVPGARISCWYDPKNPGDVVVRRGFGGAYLFALFPLPVFWVGLKRLKGAR